MSGPVTPLLKSRPWLPIASLTASATAPSLCYRCLGHAELSLLGHDSRASVSGFLHPSLSFRHLPGSLPRFLPLFARIVRPFLTAPSRTPALLILLYFVFLRARYIGLSVSQHWNGSSTWVENFDSFAHCLIPSAQHSRCSRNSCWIMMNK